MKVWKNLVLALVFIGLGLTGTSLLVLTAEAGTLAPGLETQMKDMAETDVLKVLVVMQDDLDIRTMDKSLHEQEISLAERHLSVVTTLRQTATTSQTDLLAELDQLAAAKTTGGVLGFTPHWIVNGIVLVAEVGVIRQIAAREDVEIIEQDLVPELIVPVLQKEAVSLGEFGVQAGFVAPGVQLVNAPRVWHELGMHGEGTLVANMDSGVDAAHPALVDRWRGNFVPAGEAWRDHADTGSPDYPIDNHGHGTHTMGTMTGATDTDTLGVAPGAQWMASNAIFAESDFDNLVIAAFEFFTDPDGNPATIDDVPDVLQNSWGVYPSPARGFASCDSRWWDAIDNCEAAGVVVTWSAGNEGPDPGSLRIPGDRASSPTNCFSIGSVGNSLPFVVSDFSARGPSGCGGEFQMKPEVVAPGEDVLSSYPGDQYGYMSGTSMAGPHVAGIVALMRQANPDLDVTDIKEILMETAVDVGFFGPDNDSGWGMVDAYAAVMASLVDLGTVQGQVTDSSTGLPIAGVEVTRTGRQTADYTDENGMFTQDMRTGSDVFSFIKFSYDDVVIPVAVDVGQTVDLVVGMNRQPLATISGTVTGPDSQPVAGAIIRTLNVPADPVMTDGTGYYALALPSHAEAYYEVMASAQDLAYEVSFLGLPSDRTVNFDLPHIIGDGFESGSFISFPWQSEGEAPMVIDFNHAQEGYFSAGSGDIGDSETSQLELDYFVTGGGNLSFQFKTDCEAYYDYLAFFIDGVLVGAWSGQSPWTEFQTPVTSGQHNFTWAYFKDSSVAGGADRAWIDRIEFPGSGVEPVPVLQWDPAPVTLALSNGFSDSTTVQLGNVGGYRLDFTVRIREFPVSKTATLSGLQNVGPKELINDGLLLANEKVGELAWVTASSVASWVQPGTVRDIGLRFDAGIMPQGMYYALVEVESNDAVNPLVTLPVILTVGGLSDVPTGAPAKRLNLIGAIPNPFNPMTHVTYELPRDVDVVLNIYDVSGRLVRELVADMQTAGQHRVRWDGRDGGGRDVASGVYFARLRIEDQIEMKPMLLLR